MRTYVNVPQEFKELVLKNGMVFDKSNNKFYIPKDIPISVFNHFIPLTIELIPSSNWRNNVRSEFKDDWEWIKRLSYRKANYRCEICNGVGDRHPVECHEMWEFDMNSKVQKLIGLISLCPTCHKTKHIGLAFINKEEDIVINQLKKINKWENEDVYKYINESFLIHDILSSIEWELDLSYLNDVIKNNSL